MRKCEATLARPTRTALTTAIPHPTLASVCGCSYARRVGVHVLPCVLQSKGSSAVTVKRPNLAGYLPRLP